MSDIYLCKSNLTIKLLDSYQYALNIEQFDAAKQLREKLAEVP